MTYCSECGSYYNKSDSVCRSCGWDLTQNERVEQKVPDLQEKVEMDLSNINSVHESIVNEPVDVKPGQSKEVNAGGETFGDMPSVPKSSEFDEKSQDVVGEEAEIKIESAPVIPAKLESLTGNIVDDAEEIESITETEYLKKTNFAQVEEVHLGKGLVKPSNIEVGVDGFHFHYEKPVHNFVKTETITKGNSKELRVTNPQYNLDAPTVREDENRGENEVKNEEKITKIQFDAGEEIDAQTADDLECKENLSEINSSEINSTELNSEPFEDEVLPVSYQEKELPEKADLTPGDAGLEPITLFQGRFTWYGVPLPTFFKIKDYAIILTDHNNQETEIILNEIRTVDLYQNWLAKLLNVGDIILCVAGENMPLVLSGVTKPKKILKILEEVIG